MKTEQQGTRGSTTRTRGHTKLINEATSNANGDHKQLIAPQDFPDQQQKRNRAGGGPVCSSSNKKRPLAATPCSVLFNQLAQCGVLRAEAEFQPKAPKGANASDMAMQRWGKEAG